MTILALRRVEPDRVNPEGGWEAHSIHESEKSLTALPPGKYALYERTGAKSADPPASFRLMRLVQATVEAPEPPSAKLTELNRA